MGKLKSARLTSKTQVFESGNEVNRIPDTRLQAVRRLVQLRIN